MPDNIVLNAGSGGATLATDDDATAQHQYVKVEFGGDNTQTKVTTSVGLPTDPLDRAARDCGKVDVAALDQYTPIDVDSGVGTENAVPVTLRIAASGASIAQTYGSGNVDAGTQRVTVAADSTGVLSVDDNGAALTIDWAGTAPPIGAGLEATALRVTLATDSTGLVSVDDNAGSLTVDNPTISVVGSGVEATAQRVTIASDSTGVLSVDDNGAALTIDWAGTAPPIGAGLEATALRVTLATDSTCVVSVDDNGGILTVDGTVTANLSATDNAVLDTIDAV